MAGDGGVPVVLKVAGGEEAARAMHASATAMFTASIVAAVTEIESVCNDSPQDGGVGVPAPDGVESLGEDDKQCQPPRWV